MVQGGRGSYMTNESKSLLGYCPECYRAVNKRSNGMDTCMLGHVYPSVESLPPKGMQSVVPSSEEELKEMASVYHNAKSKFTPDQEKAIGLILSGQPFVLVSCRPTKESFDGKHIPCDPVDATGCDFFTCMDGDKDTLMAAKEEVPNIIDRLYKKRGLI